MIFDPRLKNNPPESLILDILSKKVKLTSKETFEYFSNKYHKKMTIQGFYKVIRKLLDNRILLKDGAHISLDSFWINRVIEFSKNIEATYIQTKVSFANVLLEEGESRRFEFENIIMMDNFWAHSLNLVRHYYENNDYRDKNIYSRNYFSVFHIARTESENINTQYFGMSSMNWYMASGSNTFLNKLPMKLITEKSYRQFIFDFDEYNKNIKTVVGKNYWVTVIGDFIFEAKFPNYIFELIEEIYNNTQSIADFNADKIKKLFYEPGKAILTISRDEKQAEELRQDIKGLYEKYGNC